MSGMTGESMDASQARRIAFASAGLGAEFPKGGEGAAAVLRHLSALQIDTLSVVERAHHHVLWSRVPRYAKRHLDALESEPRRAIEYWSHAAAYIPVEDYRYCLPRMERVKRDGHDWFRYDPKVARRVLERIRAEGPLRVQDFSQGGDGPSRASGGWWEWKPAKIALEYLFHAGELVSISREGFQKRYDLAERALPEGLDLRMPDSGGMAAYYVDAAERSLGIFEERDVAYMRKDLTEGIPGEIAQRLADGRLVAVEMDGGHAVGGRGARRAYASPAALEAAARPASGRSRAFILSPFDPLLIDRRRFRRLFGEDFQIECYLPEAKRRFGYFALPILFRDTSGDVLFAGRLDARADRPAGVLELKRLSVSGIALGGTQRARASFAAALGTELARFARFNGCESMSLLRLDADDARLEAACRAAIGRRDGGGVDEAGRAD